MKIEISHFSKGSSLLATFDIRRDQNTASWITSLNQQCYGQQCAVLKRLLYLPTPPSKSHFFWNAHD